MHCSNCWKLLRVLIPLRVVRQSHGLKSLGIGQSAGKHLYEMNLQRLSRKRVEPSGSKRAGTPFP